MGFGHGMVTDSVGWDGPGWEYKYEIVQDCWTGCSKIISDGIEQDAKQ